MVRLDVKLRRLFTIFQSHERLGRPLINWNYRIVMSTYFDRNKLLQRTTRNFDRSIDNVYCRYSGEETDVIFAPTLRNIGLLLCLG